MFPRLCHTGTTCPFICPHSLSGLSWSNNTIFFCSREVSKLNVLWIELQLCNQNADDNDDKSDDNHHGKWISRSFMFL